MSQTALGIQYDDAIKISNHSHADVGNDSLNDLLFDIGYRMDIYLLQPAPLVALTLALVGIVFNLFSMAALCQIPNRLNTHYRLILSLAMSDTLMGISIVLYLVNRVLNPSIMPGIGSSWNRIKSRCPFIVIKALSSTSMNISLLNLMGMSVDHYTAITKPLRYVRYSPVCFLHLNELMFSRICLLCGSAYISGYD